MFSLCLVGQILSQLSGPRSFLGGGTPVPAGGGGVPQRGYGYPPPRDTTGERALTMRRAVRLLRARRKTVFFVLVHVMKR